MFISIEGIEGTGKSTVAAALTKRLNDNGIPVLLSREPGGTDIAESIRKVLLQNFTNETMTAKVELMLMFASRVQHVEAKIKPALAKGSWVICDRFVDASYAYQGGGRGIDHDLIHQLHMWSITEFMPSKTILLDMAPDKAFERVRLRNNGKDRIEQEEIEFFERVRAKYLQLANSDKNRFFTVNADQAPEIIINLILDEVATWI